ncbi:MAG TPA: Nramp family divalent metal transporter [Streptosporangiales bacterium]
MTSETLRIAGARVLARTALLGPAFVAAVAYVDPGNVATNLTGGARYGYLLVWVVVAASAMAALVQYLSAKLGVVTGRSLPELLGARLPTAARLPFWLQAELVAVATDLAEVVGGAIALALLFDVPLLIGGLITSAVSLLLLAARDHSGQRAFERVVTGLLLVIACGFVAGLFVEPPSAGATVRGMVPGFAGSGSVLLAAGMLGATVMPHVVYLHSALARDRHGVVPAEEREGILSTTRLDIGIAMTLAGAVNVSMLLLAASALHGAADTATIPGAYAEITHNLGKAVAVLFAVGLLASGFASTSVGCYAGAVVMQGLLHKRIPMLVRRVVTAIPALVVIGVGVDPTRALVVSQVVLSLGIPFALVPLVAYTSRRSVVGDHANATATTVVATAVAVAIIALNVTLLVVTFAG